jgi:hypothetical protein
MMADQGFVVRPPSDCFLEPLGQGFPMRGLSEVPLA